MHDLNKPAAQALKQAGAELVAGELNDRASLDRASQNASGVFSVQTFQAGLDTKIRQGKAVADAAKAADIPHCVYSLVGSTERNTDIPHFDNKFQVKEYIRASELPYTTMQPVFFYNYNAMRPTVEKGALPQPLSSETKLQQLSEEDYGEMVAEE